MKDPSQRRGVGAIEPFGQHHRISCLPRTAPEREARHGGDEGECEQQAPEQRQGNRDRHGPEHPAFQPLQRENRHVDQQDDQHPKADRASYLSGGEEQPLLERPEAAHSVALLFMIMR